MPAIVRIIPRIFITVTFVPKTTMEYAKEVIEPIAIVIGIAYRVIVKP